MATLPGYKIWENTAAALTTAASPLVSGWFDTTGYTNLIINFVFTTGTTALTVEGSFDGATLDSTMTYSAVSTTATVVPVQHTFVRFRVVQTVSNATQATTVYNVQSRA